MEEFDLFKKLTSGVKFDNKRFKNDLISMGLQPRNVKSKVSPDMEHDHDFKVTDEPQTTLEGDASERTTLTNVDTETTYSDNEDSDLDNEDELDPQIAIIGNVKSTRDETTTKSKKRKRVNSSALAKLKHQEQINRTRKQHRIHVHGTDIPDPIADFDELQMRYGVHSRIVENITAIGYTTPTPIQLQAITAIGYTTPTPIQLQAIPAMLEINRTRKHHRIHVHGTDIPDPIADFDELQTRYGVHSRIVENITAIGYTTPTPIQLQAIPAMLERREILACAPTGSGKTAAFIIPVLHHLKEPRNLGFRALVLSPTRELAKQTYLWFQRLSEGIGFRVFNIEKISAAKKIAGSNSAKKCDILVTTPKRLTYLLKQDPPLIDLTNVEWLIVDECDKLFEEGKSGFREQIAEIYNTCTSPNIRRAMFSATFAYDVEEWCKENLHSVVQVYIGGRNSAVDSVKQELIYVGSEDGKMLAMRNLITDGLTPPVLVFVQSRDRAKQLFQEMLYDGINVDVIHADRTQKERENVIRSLRAGDIWVLICTELLGRGIDFYGVKLVVNFDFPTSAISYIHRIGRTGRAGQQGRAVTFFTDNDAIYLRNIANVMREAGCPVPDYMVQIKKQKGREKRKQARRVPIRDEITTTPQLGTRQEERRKKMHKNRERRRFKKKEKTNNEN